MIERIKSEYIKKLLVYFPAVGIVGPRQVGKTTLVKNMMDSLAKPCQYFDLESPAVYRQINADPEWFFEQYQDQTVIIDEVQMMLSLFPVLRSLIDRQRVAARFILLGSASPEFLSKSSETLAGRIAYTELNPITVEEAVSSTIGLKLHWFRGGYPDALLAPDNEIWQIWQQNFIKTYIERDLGRLGMTANSVMLFTLLKMLTGIHGSLLNYAGLANSLQIDQRTLTRYMDILEHAFIVRRLQPWFINISKRLVKSPKLYFRDSGNLHYLADITDYQSLISHSVVGNSWEGYVVEQICCRLNNHVKPYFYRTTSGAEMDLVLVKGIEPMVSIEIKLSTANSITRGSTEALQDLKTKHNFIITTDGGDFLYRPEWRVCNVLEIMKYLKELNLIA